MNRANSRRLYWAPRVLGIAYALFISVFALDVFEANLPPGRRTIPGLSRRRAGSRAD